jgi:hypothetical protein
MYQFLPLYSRDEREGRAFLTPGHSPSQEVHDAIQFRTAMERGGEGDLSDMSSMLSQHPVSLPLSIAVVISLYLGLMAMERGPGVRNDQELKSGSA